jgi:hypothetical protein
VTGFSQSSPRREVRVVQAVGRRQGSSSTPAEQMKKEATPAEPPETAALEPSLHYNCRLSAHRSQTNRPTGKALVPQRQGAFVAAVTPGYHPGVSAEGPSRNNLGIASPAQRAGRSKGRQAVDHRGLKGREKFYRSPPSLSAGSLGLSGRRAMGLVDPGHRPGASALGLDLPARWAGRAGHLRHLSDPARQADDMTKLFCGRLLAQTWGQPNRLGYAHLGTLASSPASNTVGRRPGLPEKTAKERLVP